VTGWNIADVLDVVAAQVPDSPAVIQGPRRLTWADLDRRAERIAEYLVDAGLQRQDKVAQYLRNCPEYIESMYAALKASLVPVNTNYRYRPAELTYLWQDAEARAVVFGSSYAPVIEQMRHEVPEIRVWLCVDEGDGRCPSWAVPYEQVPTTPQVDPLRRWQRNGDDLVLLYTGGTTGMPKGVMWRQDDLLVVLGNAANGNYPDEPDLEFARSRVATRGRRHLTAAPLMHGAGCFTCIPILARGGAVVVLENQSFDATELLDTVERESVYSVSWVGDAFARPVLAALQNEPNRWNLESWRVITSGGVLFSDDVKRGLLDRVPGVLIADVYGSSEALAAARSVSTKNDDPAAPKSPRAFSRTSSIRVFTEDGRDVQPGEVGIVAYGGRQPLGYFRDEAKTAAAFRVVGGARFSITGDFATVDADGMITVLGRGSSCINTGGEKVYPEEVEEVLKRHDSVEDVVVLGVPDERLGEQVVAVVETAGAQVLDTEALTAFARAALASYKVPRRMIVVDRVTRGANGKVDYAAARAVFADESVGA
jgi:acyl-CoA synthetase (AMP-forming)/AMP-acid ligase II